MLIVALVFSGQRTPTAATPVEANPIIVETVNEQPVAQSNVLELENQQLREAVQLLQDREAQFVEQINIANEQLAAPAGEYEEEDEHEYEEGEEMEYEEEEHDEFEEEEYEEED